MEMPACTEPLAGKCPRDKTASKEMRPELHTGKCPKQLAGKCPPAEKSKQRK